MTPDATREPTLSDLFAEVDAGWPTMPFLVARAMDIATGNPDGWVVEIGGVRARGATALAALQRAIEEARSQQ